MQFRQLEYLVAVADERHFGRAADKCFVSQSSLSAALRKLESDLGVTLIERGRAFEGLTAEGERMVVWARRILSERDDVKAEMAAGANRWGVLRLGTVPTASSTLSHVIDAFCADHRGSAVELDSGLSPTEIVSRLRSGDLDVGVSYRIDGGTEDVEQLPLYREGFAVVAGDARAQSPDDDHWTRAVSELPLALVATETWPWDVVAGVLRSRGLSPAPQVMTDSISTLFSMVHTGRWATIVPETWLSMAHEGSAMRAMSIAEPSATAETVLVVSAAATTSLIAPTLAASVRSFRPASV